MHTHCPLYGYKHLFLAVFFILPLVAFSQIPANDDSCPTDANPPIDLTAAGSHLGTTCEATFDLANINCDADTEVASVWYTYTPNAADDGYDVTLSPAGGTDDAEGPITLEIYKGTINQGCTGFSSTLGASCSSPEAAIKIPNDFDSGEIIYIKVTTAPDLINCGEFMISIIPATCGAFANTCSDITSAQTLNPITNDMFILDYNCVSGCIDYATPDPSATGGCEEFADNPTVWYKINVDDQAQQMYTTVDPIGNWDAVWSIYGGTDCTDLEIISSIGQTCSNGDFTPELFQIAVESIYESYWLAVTVDPNSIPITGIEDGTFEVCVSTSINAIVCLGNLEGDCAEPSLVIEVTERELEGGSLDGPFCPGEEISIHLEFFFDASETSSDWLSGIIPKFGPGWNIENFDYNAFAPIGNGSTAEWLEEDGPCAPAISEMVPHLCTYIDENGNLALCNSLCESCNECPSLGMEEEDPLPSGYFWVSNGGSAGCENDCSPQEGWGIGSTTALVVWDFTLSVKDYVDYETCFANNDLQISFQSFSQGVVGCWEDPIGECLIDKSQFGPLWKVDCILPSSVEGENQEICSGETTSVFVSTTDGSANTVIVTPIENFLVTGESSYSFTGGSGIITDNLVNNSSAAQVVEYLLYSEDFTLTCPGGVNTVEVVVFPQVELDANSGNICQGECATIFPEIFGGSTPPYNYLWSTGATTAEITVCPQETTTYFVSVEDALGCQAMYEIQVNVAPYVDILLPEDIFVCKDDEYDPTNPDYVVCLEFLNGTLPYEVIWNAPPGLVGTPAGINGECFIINEMTTSAFGGNNGEYILGASVTDNSACMDETEMIVNVTGELTIIPIVQNLECDDTNATISVTGIDALGNPISSFLLYGGCPEDEELGDFLAEANPTTGVATFQEVDLLSYTCYTIVGQSEFGCQEYINIEIPITEGIPIEISGTPNVCNGEETTIKVNNASDYIAFIWTPNIGNTPLVVFVPDSTMNYFVEATDATGCVVKEVYNVVVHDENSPLCADPCENQISDYQITGLAYSDDNANGIQDEGELPLNNVLIKDLDNDFTVFTNVFGVYAIPVDPGVVNLQASISLGQWTNPEIDRTINIEIPCVPDVNFGFIPEGNSPLTNISVNNTITRCDFETKFFITVENQNHEAINGIVEFTFDPKTTFFSSDIIGLDVINNKATFPTGILPAFTPTTFVITLKMPGGSSVLPTLNFSTSLFEGDELLDTYFYSQELKCSYDPNDKRTFPDRPGDENPTLKEDILEYTIRFQNNGNDTAFHVRLIDIIDPNIIKSSIRFINSSHPFEACLSNDSLIMNFESIQLVDSMTNYEASQGYISFSCNIDPNVAIDTEISNIAEIFFDTNPPIGTNTTLNTIVDMLCVNTSTDIDEEICLGESYMGYDQSGSYQMTLTTDLGCDSTINLELLVIEPEQATVADVIVCGDTYVVDILGTTYELDSSGIYVFEIEGPSGCIEYIVTHGVTLVVPEEKFEEFTICNGDLIEYDGNTYTVDSTGNYVYEIMDQIGCVEQILHFDITVITAEKNFFEFEMCEGGILTFEDEVYEFDSSGIYSYLIEGASGCNELELIFDVTVFQTTYTEFDTTICEGQSYEGLEVAGIYTIENADPITGCPIVETLTLTVLPLSDPACIVSVSDVILNEIEVFPIPTNNSLFIRSEVEMQDVIILSTTGKILSKQNNISSRELKMDVSQLPVGFHFIVIETSLGRVMKKVIISR